ncbi:hypothetical protein K501DRAFT_272564 [Backusella circina FSU 941]|nr:hypothetical protein K501DRAFT_272564 [Backusella circina FSU 941]
MKQDNHKPVFKEKFVELTEELFKGHSSFSYNSSLFWDGYLILKVNKKCITQLIRDKTEEELLALGTTFTSLFRVCLEQLSGTKEDVNDERRQLNALEILAVLIRSLFSKKRLTHFNIISMLTGLEKADLLFTELVKSTGILIKGKHRSAALQLALVLSAGNDNINQNGLNGMVSPRFHPPFSIGLSVEYHWAELWPTLASISHFTALRIDELQSNEVFNSYLSSFVGVLNLCVTHGETFLNDTKSYDCLFYEIIRSTSDFITLSSYASKLSYTKGRSPVFTGNEFSNIKLICNHFKPALDEWQTNHNIKFPTPEQVMYAK